MHPINGFGCHKLPPGPPPRPVADGLGEGPSEPPDLSVPLLMRVRFAIVCSWLEPTAGEGLS